jgi:PEP-CTERM motif
MEMTAFPTVRQTGILAFLLIATTLLSGFLAQAHAVVVPNDLTSVEGNSGVGGGLNTRYQQVYAASDFTGAIFISEIAFRPTEGSLPLAPMTITGVRFDLSTTSASPDNLSTTFAANVGADNTTVFSGNWTRSSASTGPAGGPLDFDIILTLTTPFLYDPALGNLLLDVRNPSSQLLFTGIYDAHVEVGDAVSVISGDVNATTGQVGFAGGGSIGLVTRFSAVSVPEPGTLTLLAIGGLLFAMKKGSRR